MSQRIYVVSGTVEAVAKELQTQCDLDHGWKYQILATTQSPDGARLCIIALRTAARPLVKKTAPAKSSSSRKR